METHIHVRFPMQFQDEEHVFEEKLSLTFWKNTDELVDSNLTDLRSWADSSSRPVHSPKLCTPFLLVLFPLPLPHNIHSYSPSLCISSSLFPVPGPPLFLHRYSPTFNSLTAPDMEINPISEWLNKLNFYVVIPDFKSWWVENFTFTDRDGEIHHERKKKRGKKRKIVFSRREKKSCYIWLLIFVSVFPTPAPPHPSEVNTRKTCLWPSGGFGNIHMEPWASTVGPEHSTQGRGQEFLPSWARPEGQEAKGGLWNQNPGMLRWYWA